MRKNKKRNRSNKRNTEAKVCSCVDCVNSVNSVATKIAEKYCSDNDMMENEMMIARCVLEHGENEALHMFYYASIVAFVVVTGAELPPICLYDTEDSATVDYGNAFVVDMIARTIYKKRKDDLGLQSITITGRDFSFEVATRECFHPVDLDSMTAIMDRMESKVMASLTESYLKKEEVVITPAGKIVNPFAFYKILSEVIFSLKGEAFYTVRGLKAWSLIVAFYETANRIFTKYAEP